MTVFLAPPKAKLISGKCQNSGAVAPIFVIGGVIPPTAPPSSTPEKWTLKPTQPKQTDIAQCI